MIFDRLTQDEPPRYSLVAPSSDLEEAKAEDPAPASLDASTQRKIWIPLLILGHIFMAIVGFGAGVFYNITDSSSFQAKLDGAAQRIRLPLVKREFMDDTPFLVKPPRGEGSGNVSEPIWDSLIPNGLGYFKHDQIAPRTSIPTVFHQLHCLYIIRRAYYQETDDLQEFDFGKDRDVHVAHCLDYLRQGLTCTIDTTVEPAVGKQGEFLGFGFDRQCQDFDALKSFVEEHRSFDATGFLAAGLDHGRVHLDED